MLTPDGIPAGNIDKIMLLSMWTKTLNEENGLRLGATEHLPMISAGMGKPTFAVNEYTIQTQIKYWQNIQKYAQLSNESAELIKEGAAISYGDPRGDQHARIMMSAAMSAWYETPIIPENILFTIGGAGALRVIFETFNAMYQSMTKYRVITPFPYYTLYADNKHVLHPIDVMKQPGYKLTALDVKSSIEEANQLAENDGGYPKIILICNPNNPLGTVIESEELQKIAEVLRQFPDIYIVLDEAYAELCFYAKKAPSILAIAPDLKNRTIVMRSATKALSAAGERMAILLAFEQRLMTKLLDKNISTIGHAPRSSQIAYAETMANFHDADHQKLVAFYRNKVLYVSERLQTMGALMPDPTYKPEATFYVLADLSDLIGLELPEESARALGKIGQVETSEDITYYLLFKDSIMIAPLSYYGLPSNQGFMRITCSSAENELCDLMNRLEKRLLEARKIKKTALMDKLSHTLAELKNIDEAKHDEIISKMIEVASVKENCWVLKFQNQTLEKLDNSARLYINKSTEVGRVRAATTIQSYFRGYSAKKERKALTDYNDCEWKKFVRTIVPDSTEMQAYFLSLSISKRLKFLPWKEHLDKLNAQNRM